jgi:hypothetical protein
VAIDPMNRNKQRLSDLIPGKAASPVAMFEQGKKDGADPAQRKMMGQVAAASLAPGLGSMVGRGTAIAAGALAAPVAASYTDDGAKPAAAQGRGLDLIQRARDASNSLRDFGSSVYDTAQNARKVTDTMQRGGTALRPGVKNSSVDGIYEGRGEFGERAFSNNAEDPILQGKSAGRGGFVGSLKDLPGQKGIDTTDSKAMVDMYRQTSQIYRDTSNRSLGIPQAGGGSNPRDQLGLRDMLRFESDAQNRASREGIAASQRELELAKLAQSGELGDKRVSAENKRNEARLDSDQAARLQKGLADALQGVDPNDQEGQLLARGRALKQVFGDSYLNTPQGRALRGDLGLLIDEKVGGDVGDKSNVFDPDFTSFENVEERDPTLLENVGSSMFGWAGYEPDTFTTVGPNGNKIEREPSAIGSRDLRRLIKEVSLADRKNQKK